MWRRDCCSLSESLFGGSAAAEREAAHVPPLPSSIAEQTVTESRRCSFPFLH